jgi:outer membrane protein assembly factor BamD
LAINSTYDLKKERLEMHCFTRTVEKEFPDTDNAKDAVEQEKDFKKKPKTFAKLQKRKKQEELN